MIDKDLVENVIKVLNRALEKDEEAINRLFDHYVPCNRALLNDETIQIDVEDGTSKISVLGLINGLLSDGSPGPIAKVISSVDGTIIRFDNL